MPNVVILAQKLKEQGAKAIIITGDIPLNEELRNNNQDREDDALEITTVLLAAAKTGLPIYVIPGNHETKESYQTGIEEAQRVYSTIIDLTQYRFVNSTTIDLISLPGYQTQSDQTHRFIPSNGYYAAPEQIREIITLQSFSDNPTILITHGPPFTGAIAGPGTIASGIDVGDKYTSTILQTTNITLVLSGHIHEAGGLAATLNGREIEKNIWNKMNSETIVLNAGSAAPSQLLNGSIIRGMAVFVEFQNAALRFYPIEVEN